MLVKQFSAVLVLFLLADVALAQLQKQRLPTTPPTFPQKTVSEKDVMDINSAGEEQLMTLPGVSETVARRIIDHRPYKKKTELKKKKIVSEEVYKNIADKITAVRVTK